MDFGIANIVNKTNGKQFIFKSKNLVKSIENTRNQLNFGCHYNKYLQNDWDELGPDSFNFNIVESNIENELLLDQKFIKYLDDVDYIYNLPIKDLIQVLDCDIEILTNKLYDLTGNEVNSDSFNKKLKKYNLSNQDGFNFKINFKNKINKGLINHSNFDKEFDNLFIEITENKLIDSLYSSLDELNFDDKIRKYGLNEDSKLAIIDKLKDLKIKGKIKNERDLLNNIDTLIQEEYSKNLTKEKAYEKLYSLTGKDSLKRDYKYLLRNKGLSNEVGLNIRNKLENSIEKGEVTELNIEDIFNILIEDEFKKLKEESYNEKQILISFFNQMDFQNLLKEHHLHKNAQYLIKEEISLQINQNKIKTEGDIEVKSLRFIKDLELADVEARLKDLDNVYIDKILMNNNLKAGFLSRKQSKINKIMKNVPVKLIKENLERYTGELKIRFIQNPNIVYCPQCRALNDRDSEYCNQCGSPIK